MPHVEYRLDPTRASGRQKPEDAREAWRKLEEGNRSFVSLLDERAEGAPVLYFSREDLGCSAEGVPIQQPFAVVLGCSDARAPTEMIFDRACNELFIVRVAGNILGQEQLGSIDYAVENFGPHLKALVVLGHSQCGAVTATVDAFLKPTGYLGLASSHHVRAIVNSLFPAVRGAAAALATQWGDDITQQPGYREALIETSVVLNAALMASILREEYGNPEADRLILFGVYDLATRCVHVPSPHDARGARTTRLREAPAGAEDFRQFAAELVSSPFVRQLLGR